MIASYQDALTYLYDNLPMFQRVGPVAYKKDLHNTQLLCRLLDNPENKFRSIHVAGTNGKGSTAHMLSSVFQTAGYKTGLYTSPHLKEFTERIKVNGVEVSQEFVVEFVRKMIPAMEEIRPSFFEITVAMAFDYFVRQNVDIAIVEVGLGGRLDSTNVITPIASVITNISWDHKELLGDTLARIASEKAGIIKQGIPVVVSERQPAVQDVFIDKAHRENAPLFFASDEYAVELTEGGSLLVLKGGKPFLQDVPFPLRGFYQKKNIPGVVKTMEVVNPVFPVSEEELRNGLEQVITQTQLKGRWQKIHSNPTVICDTAHNTGGIKEIVEQIASVRYTKLHIVWGMVKDKDIEEILSMLPKQAVYYFCQATIPRALDADILQCEAKKHGLNGMVVRDVNQAKDMAISKAGKDDFIFVGGSTYVVSEIREL